MSSAVSAHDALGIAGFTFADLHQPARLYALYELFCAEVRRSDPELWAQWEAHHLTPSALGPVARSNLLVDMAPHVSRFVTRLFSVGPEADAMVAQTRAYDDLFRFKIDFVRRRALPLLKGGAHVEATAGDHDLIERLVMTGRKPGPSGDGSASVLDDGTRELALARAGCEL